MYPSGSRRLLQIPNFNSEEVNPVPISDGAVLRGGMIEEEVAGIFLKSVFN
jgi:hypothetical protein